MQALAQSTIQDLHNKLAARSAEVGGGEQRLQAARSLAAAEVCGLQDQIEQLTHQLQLQDQRHVKVSPGKHMNKNLMEEGEEDDEEGKKSHHQSTPIYVPAPCQGSSMC